MGVIRVKGGQGGRTRREDRTRAGRARQNR